MANTEDNANVVNQQPLGTDEVKDQAVETPDVKQSNVPYFRFKEVNDQLNDMKTTVSNLKANEEEREAKIKAEKGEFKELYEKEVELRKTAEAKSVKADEYFAGRREQIMSNWSDEDKEIYGDMPLENLPSLAFLRVSLLRVIYGTIVTKIPLSRSERIGMILLGRGSVRSINNG